MKAKRKPQTIQYTNEQLQKLNAGLELVKDLFDYVDPDLSSFPELNRKSYDIERCLDAFRNALSLLRFYSVANGKRLSQYETGPANDRANRLELLAVQVGLIAYCEIETDDDHCDERALSPEGKRVFEDLKRIEAELHEVAARCRTVNINEARQ